MAFHVLLVSGSWHVPAHFETTIDELKKRGISASTFLHPTCDLTAAGIEDVTHPDLSGSPPKEPWPNMYVDAAQIKRKIEELIEAGMSVLIVPHSYGGLPASEALLSQYTRDSRSKQGEKGGVIGMFAISSFFLPVGMSTTRAMGGRPIPSVPRQPSGLTVVRDPAYHLFNDLSLTDAQHYISLLRPQSSSVHDTPCTNAGFLNVPCAFLKTMQDNICPLAGQEAGIQGARKLGANIKEYEIDAGHEPFLSRTRECVDYIVDFSNRIL